MTNHFGRGPHNGHAEVSTYGHHSSIEITAAECYSICRIDSVGSPHEHAFADEDVHCINESVDLRSPDLLPAKDVLSSIAKSAANDTYLHDQDIKLMSFGFVPDGSSGDEVSVAAFTTNAARKKLCIMQFHGQRQGWSDDKRTGILVPQLVREHEVWQSPYSIQQIQFCEPSDGTKGFLAVRTLAATFVLRARLAKEASARVSSGGGRLRISVICIVPSSIVGSKPHIHVDINPWNPRQFVVIQSDGAWNVLQAGPIKLGMAVEDVEVLGSGIIMEVATIDALFVSPSKTWAKASWIVGSEQILLCSHRTLTLVHLSLDLSHDLSLDDETGNSQAVYRDVQRLPSFSKCFVILTSIHLHLLLVSEYAFTSQGSAGAPKVRTLVKLRHHRDQNDATLRISTVAKDDAMLILLNSRVNPTITMYTLRDHSESEDAHFSIIQSALWQPPPALRASVAYGLWFRPVPWELSPQTSLDRGYAESLAERGVNFVLVIGQGADLNIIQQLIAYIPVEGAGSKPVRKPDWKRRVKVTASRILKQRFVVSDTEIEDHGQIGSELQLSPLDNDVSVCTNRMLDWTMDFERIYQLLTDSLFIGHEDASSIVSRISTVEIETDSRIRRQRLLAEFLPVDLRVGDFDELAAATEGMQHDAIASAESCTTFRMATTTAVPRQSIISNATTINALYRELTSSFLSSLSEEIPGRARLAREQLLRRVSLHVLFAGLYTEASVLDPAEAPLQSSQPKLQVKSQTLQAPEVLSQVNESVAARFGPARRDSAGATLNRLAKYTEVEALETPFNNTSSSVHAILAHWDLRSTPNAYDWMSTVIRLEAQAEEADYLMSLTERDRQKLDRRRVRLAERKSREEERMHSIRSSQAEAPRLVMTSSQIRGSQAQSQHQEHSQSQVPGFGQIGAGARLPVRSSPSRRSREDSPSQSLQPVGSQTSNVGPSQTSQVQSSQIRGTTGPPPRKKFKRRAEGF